jgi:histone-lysine N-methyltransferase SETD8
MVHVSVCSLDGTAERPDYGIGRLISHSRKDPNLRTIKLVIEHIPHLAFIAKRDIEKGEELAYDYGDYDGEVTSELQWLNNS